MLKRLNRLNSMKSVDNPRAMFSKSKTMPHGKLLDSSSWQKPEFLEHLDHLEDDDSDPPSDTPLKLSGSSTPKRLSRSNSGRLKVDYKTALRTVSKRENFGTALHRVSSFLSKNKLKTVRRDLREYERHPDTLSHCPLRDQSHLLDDITFGDVTAYNVGMTEQQRAIIRQTLRRRKWERRRNEIEARHAILCANELPIYKEWMDRHEDRPWIRRIHQLVTCRPFNDFIMFVIILNTAIYALVWPEQVCLVLLYFTFHAVMVPLCVVFVFFEDF